LAKAATVAQRRGAASEPPKQQAATRRENPLATASMPTFMQGMAGMGTEKIGAGDIETPRLKLLQSVSPECEQFDTAKQGDFWHSVAEVSLGKEVKIVPLYIDMRAILWRPRHEGGGILARADDGINWSPAHGSWNVQPFKDNKKRVTWKVAPTVAASGLLEWGSSDPDDPNSPPAATRMYNMALALPDFPELGIGVVTLQRAGIRVARKFMGKLKLMSMPSFGCYFTMTNVKDQNDQGDTFYNYSFNAEGFVQDEEEFLQYKELYEGFKRMGLNIKDLETAQDEGVLPGHAEAPEDAKARY
jgi:hypothetical protein